MTRNVVSSMAKEPVVRLSEEIENLASPLERFAMILTGDTAKALTKTMRVGTEVSSVCDTDKRYGRPCTADALLFGSDERSGEAFTSPTCYAEEAVALIGSSKNR